VTEPEALQALLGASTLAEAREAVRALTRGGAFAWRPLGDKEGNFGLVNIGSEPGLAFVERVTNALDAVVDLAAAAVAPEVRADLESPRDAPRRLFAIPEGRLTHLDEAAARELASRVVVRTLAGSARERPTLEVRDFGTGITPEQMPDTILNLADSNKIDKPYLAGAYGQGGSTTFAFAPGGSLIASATAGSALGITFVRYRALDPHRNKNGRYEYLVRARGKSVATLPAGAHEFPRGTLVRHFDYDLGDEGLGALRVALFDPVLPFTLVESPGFLSGVPEIVRGRVAQLEAAGSAIEYRQAMTFPLGRNACDGLVRVQYWVLARDDDPLHEAPQRPVLLTNFGQTHGTEDRRFIVETLRLPYLKSALIVSIELDALAPSAKRELLSTTRDRLKRGARYRALLDGVRDALLDDPELARANAERRRCLLDRQNATDQKRLRKRLAELMEKFRPGDEAGAAAARNGKGGATAARDEAGDGAGGVLCVPHAGSHRRLRRDRRDGARKLPAFGARPHRPHRRQLDRLGRTHRLRHARRLTAEFLGGIRVLRPHISGRRCVGSSASKAAP
jgi:hypothetical protein